MQAGCVSLKKRLIGCWWGTKRGAIDQEPAQRRGRRGAAGCGHHAQHGAGGSGGRPAAGGAEQHANELLNISDRREMAQRLDAIGTLDTLSDMPLKVTDPDWMQKLDGDETCRAQSVKGSNRKR